MFESPKRRLGTFSHFPVPVLVTQRDVLRCSSPNPPAPPINSPYGGSSIWSPASIDSCLEGRNYPASTGPGPGPAVPAPGSAASGTAGAGTAGSAGGGGSSGGSGGGQPSWGQGYYYSNMDYLGPGAAQLNVVQVREPCTFSRRKKCYFWRVLTGGFSCNYNSLPPFQDNNLDSVWPKREDPTWFYNSSSWERK